MRLPFTIVAVAFVVAGCATTVPSEPPRPQARHVDSAEVFARAVDDYQQGRLQEALPAFETLQQQYPALADYHLYYAGLISERLGDRSRAQSSFESLLRDYPRSVKASATRLELGQLLLHDGQLDEARAVLQPLADGDDAATANAARIALAEVDEESGAVETAYAAYVSVRRAAPASRSARIAKEHVATLRLTRPELVPTGAQRVDELHLLLAERDFTAAGNLARTMLADPQGGDAPDVWRAYADALAGQGQTEEAVVTLQQLATRYPDSPAAPEALFRAASLLWNRDHDAEALTLFERFLHRYPNDGRAADALYAIGRIHRAAGQRSEALRSFADLVERYPSSKIANEARWQIGWAYYTAGDWRAAAAAFARLAEVTTGETAAGARYWQARALDHAGDSQAASTRYAEIVEMNPDGYYAMCVELRIDEATSAGRGPPTAADTGTALDPGEVDPGPFPGSDTFHSSRAEELRRAHLYSLSRAELAAIERDYGGDPEVTYYLLRAYPGVNGYANAIRLAQKAPANLPASERQRVMYPLAFWADVQREGGTVDVDPLLVEALMRQESRFDPLARSPANALGLMQLLPSTAARAAGSTLDDEVLFEPQTNIQLGVRHLRSVLDRYGGDPIKALAAYNGGEAAVEKWQRQFADLDSDEFVESITYRETRDYVKKVMGNYRVYQRVYRGN